ncbi:putative beta-lysine N-acetyltransferase [uncultured Desulfosarcina sp.]|uniref:putative beta-lysine N-acetyltransferase n=1 Tax=uncultured Desulfosarcina sp. TaxID=218289 RepID=UPI0029C6F824|nr:putative beta-lysine N-acetyltransferase [uncultured Desulfosarcina sp.]
MTQDRIQTIGHSRIKYGPLSDRVYLMRLGDGQAPLVIDAMQSLARAEGYTKLIAKIPDKSAAAFTDAGFEMEARIPDFYADGDAALFMSRFRSEDRRGPSDAERIRKVLEAALRRADAGIKRPLPDDCELTLMNPDHALPMANLYGRVFESYPFPIFDPAYIRRTMEENFRYFGIFRNASLIALASAERSESGVEMTDFATASAYRRASLAAHLLAAMEADARQNGVKTAFTIARAVSYGINIMFARCGYTFAGTLVNNTNISGRVQSMNIWYKPLASSNGTVSDNPSGNSSRHSP